MKKLIAILLILGATNPANALWDYYQGSQQAALLDLALGTFPGYDQMYGAYQGDGTNLLFHQYAQDSSYVDAYKNRWNQTPNTMEMNNYHNVIGFIDSYERAQRALQQINTWDGGLMGLTNPMLSPRSNVFLDSAFSSI